jgi:hypothetical protein
MKANEKHPEIDALLSVVFGVSRNEAISEGLCATCEATGIEIQSFRDDISVDEYMISGMCQKCQDSVFGA